MIRIVNYGLWFIGAVVLCGLSSVFGQSTAEPPASGVFCKAQGKWTELHPAALAASKTGSLDVMEQTDGLAPVNTVDVYAGPSAAVQLSDRKPEFYIHGLSYGCDSIIIHVTQKGGNRQARSSTAQASSDNKVGYKKAEVRRVTTRSVSKETCTITPETELKPGEYLLVLQSGKIVYDFGIK